MAKFSLQHLSRSKVAGELWNIEANNSADAIEKARSIINAADDSMLAHDDDCFVLRNDVGADVCCFPDSP